MSPIHVCMCEFGYKLLLQNNSINSDLISLSIVQWNPFNTKFKEMMKNIHFYQNFMLTEHLGIPRPMKGPFIIVFMLYPIKVVC